MYLKNQKPKNYTCRQQENDRGISPSSDGLTYMYTGTTSRHFAHCLYFDIFLHDVPISFGKYAK